MQSLVLRDYAPPSVTARGHTLPHLPLRGARVLPLRHCEERSDAAISGTKKPPSPLFVIARRSAFCSDEAISGIHVPSPSLRGGTVFVPTWQSLVPRDRTNGNEGTPKERLPRLLAEARNDKEGESENWLSQIATRATLWPSQ